MTTNEIERLKARLIHAATQYDKRQKRGRFYNPWALPQYVAAIGEAVDAVKQGKTPRLALLTTFCDRLRDALLKGIGEPPATREEIEQCR